MQVLVRVLFSTLFFGGGEVETSENPPPRIIGQVCSSMIKILIAVITGVAVQSVKYVA